MKYFLIQLHICRSDRQSLIKSKSYSIVPQSASTALKDKLRELNDLGEDSEKVSSVEDNETVSSQLGLEVV